MPRRTWILALLFLVACRSTPPAEELEPYDVEAGLASFDMSWERIGATYFNADMDGVDWDQVRADLRPRAAAATSRAELREVIRDLMGHLNKSHFEVMSPGDTSDFQEGAVAGGWVGLDVRSLDGKLVVTRVTADTPAARAGVQLGWILQSVDGRELDAAQPDDSSRRHMGRHGVALHYLNGEVGSTVSVTFADDGGKKVALEFTRTEHLGQTTRLPGLPPHVVEFASRRIALDDGQTVGYIRFDLWSGPVVARFREAIKELADTDGFVLDLRGNIGGIGALAMGIAGYFIHEPASLGELRTRGDSINFNVQPRPVNAASGSAANYGGPLALLLDIHSASTTEVFAAGIQELGRARVFGEVSAGMALPAMAETLPSGDVLMHAIADFATPEGNPLEGRGVLPDTQVTLTRPALLRGEDSVLAAALDWIQTEPKGTSR